MKRKLQSITSKLTSASGILGIVIVWQFCCSMGWIPKFMLPSPADIIKALVTDFPALMQHSGITLLEAFLGLSLGVTVGVAAAVLMDRFPSVYKAFYPLLILTQTIPTVAIAPVLVIWMGYGIAPKVTAIVIVTFFPMAIGLLDGSRSADQDAVRLLSSMGAKRKQIFRYIKFPGAMGQFFASLKICASYSIVGAVIAEWLGGNSGLGVYMTRVRKSYAYDKMFAIIVLISVISLLLMKGVELLRRRCMPWETRE